MKTIPLAEALKILENAAAVITEDHVLVYPRLSDDDENPIFLRLEWNADGLDFLSEFSAGVNKEVTLVGSSLFLRDTHGDEKQLTILVPEKLE